MNLRETAEQQVEPKITQQEITRSLEDILFQRMNQSEVELMKAENAQLKQTLANFTSNYNKFEDLINSTIQQNNASVMRSINELNSRLANSLTEQNSKVNSKVNSLSESNDLLSQNIERVVSSVGDKLTSISNETSRELSNSVDKTTKQLEDKADTIGKKISSFWTWNMAQTCLFWSAMLSLVLLIVKPTLEVYGVTAPELVWKICYPVALAPVVLFLIISLVKAIIDKIRGY